MSIFDGLTSIRRERAALERDRVVLGSMMEDAAISDAIGALNSDFFEGVSEDELNDLIDKIPVDDSDIEDQVDRVLASDTDMDVDDILGIDVDDGGCEGPECDDNDCEPDDDDIDSLTDDLDDLDFDD